MFLLIKFCCGTPPSCLKVMGWVVGGWWVVGGGGGLEQFSVSPRPLGFGFGTKGFGAKGLGPGLDNKFKDPISPKGTVADTKILLATTHHPSRHEGGVTQINSKSENFRWTGRERTSGSSPCSMRISLILLVALLSICQHLG